MSSASPWSSGKPIRTQPTTTGAFMGTSTTWCGLPSSTSIPLALPPLAARTASRAATGAISRIDCLASPPEARNAKSVPSQAASVAPMRAPWFSSADPMVSASSDSTASRKP